MKNARELNEQIDSFLKRSPPMLAPAFPLALSFTTPDVTSPRKQMDHRLGWLCLCLVASTWSPDLFRCPRCEKFFVRKRPTKGAEPRCSRECSRADAESEKKADQRKAKHKRYVEAAQEVLDALEKLPRAERPRAWEALVADKVSQRLGLSKAITKWSITRWHSEGEINPPWEPRLRRK